MHQETGYRTCVPLLDKPQIWCIVTRLFMRPVTPQPQVFNNRSGYGAGGYRAFLIICILTGLCIIGLCYGFIRLSQTISNNSENVSGQDATGPVSNFSENYGNYYPGVIGLLRLRNNSKSFWTGFKDCTQNCQPPWTPGRDMVDTRTGFVKNF